MRHLDDNFSEERYGLHVRFVNETDAEFIVRLRTDPKLSRFLHPTSPDVSLQQQWITRYRERQHNGEDFYFMFEKPVGVRAGVCRIYDIEADSFTIGSWLFAPEAPAGAAILADIITRETAFARFPNKSLRFDVRKGNTNVLRYQATFHPTLLGEDDLNYYYELSHDNFERYKRLHLRMFAPKN